MIDAMNHKMQGQTPPLASVKNLLTIADIQVLTEREVKFEVLPGFALPDHLGTPLPPRVFTSTYFDSANHRLGKLGITLRRRVERGKGTWQLKIPSGDNRIELEIHSGSRHIPSLFQDLLIAFFRKSEPVQLGKLRTWRTGVGIQKEATPLAEVTLDSVALIKENKILGRFQEVEVEYQQRKPNQWQGVRKALEKAGAKIKSLQPKIFQVLQLPYPEEFTSPDSNASASLHIQFRLHSLLHQMLLHDPGTRLGQDREALHQMRVATRRIRSLLRTVAPILEPDWTKVIKDEVRWVGSLLGGVRDWDVLLEYFRREFFDFQGQEQRTLQRILDSFETQRQVARTRMLEGLGSDRYLNFLTHLEQTLPQLPTQSDHPPIPELAKKTFRKLEAAVDSTDGLLTAQGLHRIRISTKRARYAVELAEPFLGKVAKRFIHQAKLFQDLLGQHQDAVVAEHQLMGLSPQTRGRGIAFVSGLMVERLRHRRKDFFQRVPHQWEKLRKLGKKL